jgi:hypothetical protein
VLDVDGVPLLDRVSDATVAVLRHGAITDTLNIFLLTCTGKEFNAIKCEFSLQHMVSLKRLFHISMRPHSSVS